jgi:hypothetical protein
MLLLSKNRGVFIRKTVIYAYIILLFVISFISFGYAVGITGRTKKGGDTTGCYCHGSSPYLKVGVSISGPDSLSPGETAGYILTISGGPLVRGGTNIAVSSGTLSTDSGSGLRKLNDELTHDFPRLPEQGSVRFLFIYTAPPAEGTDTIFANGNSVNFDLLPYDDMWNFAENKVITIKNPIGINNYGTKVLSYKLEQNFPNPFNPVTLIQFEIMQNVFVELSVSDLLGRRLETLVSENLSKGIYKVKWDAARYSSGTYVYRLNAGNYTESKTMILVK